MKKKILIIASYIILAIVFLLAGITIGKKSENRLQETEAQTLIKQKVVEASFLVVNEDSKNSISQDDLTISDGLLQTYREIINSQTIKDRIKEKYPNINDIELERVPNTAVIKAIYVCDYYNEEECIEITNEYIKEFSERLSEIYNIKNIYIFDRASITNREIEV